MTDKLCVAEECGGTVVVGVKESCKVSRNSCEGFLKDSLSGFFLRKRKTVSSNSRYFVR